MKKILGFILFITICGCTATPTTSNPAVTQTLTLNSSTANLFGTGTFYDISAGTTTGFTIGGLPSSYNFSTGKHDTIEFKVSLSETSNTPPPPYNFSYIILLSSSSPTTETSTAVTTDTSGNYTSSEFTF